MSPGASINHRRIETETFIAARLSILTGQVWTAEPVFTKLTWPTSSPSRKDGYHPAAPTETEAVETPRLQTVPVHTSPSHPGFQQQGLQCRGD